MQLFSKIFTNLRQKGKFFAKILPTEKNVPKFFVAPEKFGNRDVQIRKYSEVLGIRNSDFFKLVRNSEIPNAHPPAPHCSYPWSQYALVAATKKFKLKKRKVMVPKRKRSKSNLLSSMRKFDFLMTKMIIFRFGTLTFLYLLFEFFVAATNRVLRRGLKGRQKLRFPRI